MNDNPILKDSLNYNAIEKEERKLKRFPGHPILSNNIERRYRAATHKKKRRYRAAIKRGGATSTLHRKTTFSLGLLTATLRESPLFL